MPRKARIIIPGAWHHVTQRGNNQQDVFFVEEDRAVYLKLLHEQTQRYGLVLQGYCLMTNHVHLIALPETATALAQAVGRTHFRYAQYINRMHGRSGHLWQNRFYSCPMDAQHALNALAYVELNPIRARMVRLPERYRWSSAAAHLGKTQESPYLDLDAWRDAMPSEAWRSVLNETAHNTAIDETVKVHTRTGRPLGSDSFISKAETFLGRRLRPLPVGRPKGWRKSNPKKN